MSTAHPRRSRSTAGGDSLSPAAEVEPPNLNGPALFDTGAWTWARDRRFPQLASWFNAQVAAGHVLVCDLVILELVRLSPNEARAKQVAQRLDAFKSVPMPTTLWQRVRELQLLLAATGGHRRVPPIDLLIGSAAEAAGVPLVHYDRDYERLANVCALQHHWLLPDGTLA
ncbi:MAG TPA: PIN domain-containing protein [Solirubrobacteraceae bacterium]|nr:PIN domain-containing protein [Solirubrobacteraceae bacterium]